MTIDESVVLHSLKNALSLPSGQSIISEAVVNSLGDNKANSEWIKANFSYLVETTQMEAYKVYLEAERPAAIRAIRSTLKDQLPANPTSDDFFDVLERNFWALDRFFLSLTQGRRPRAGKAFEHVIRTLFKLLEYPYSAQPVINGQPDFLLPSKAHFDSNAIDCIIFTVKRTLRERWRQITTEGTRGHIFYLATIDENVAERDHPEMLKNRIYLVVPLGIKKRLYQSKTNVITFEQFFEHHLDPAMVRWKANRII